MTIQNFAFAPPQLHVAIGTAVTWANHDSSVTHTTTADTSDPAAWNSGNLVPGATFSYTFAKPGTYTYHCAIHEYMIGAIIVG